MTATDRIERLGIVTKRDGAYVVARKHLRTLLDALTTCPQYFFSADFLTRNARKNSDGTVRPAGFPRHLICKNKPNRKPTKDWTPTPGGKLRFDPVGLKLYHVYTTEGKKGDDGKGNHWGFICLKTCWRLHLLGADFGVVEVTE